MFVDYRDGSGADASTVYSINGGSVPDYGRAYWKGPVVEREDTDRGAFVMDVAGNDGALQAGEVWSNAGGSVTVRAAAAANTVRVTMTAKPPLPAGTASISGTPIVYRQAGAIGAIPGATSYRYQWHLNGQPIAQADDATFVPTPAMSGGTLSVAVTGYAIGRNPSPTTLSAPVVVAGAQWYSNGGVTYPSIAGTPRVGNVLTASGLDWVNVFGRKPQGVLHALRMAARRARDCRGGRARLPAPGCRCRQIHPVREIPVAPGFATTSYATSDPTSLIAKGSLTTTTKPKIKGKPRVGKKLKAATGARDSGVTFKYKWYANDKLIKKKASKRTLKVTGAMRRKKITVKVTGLKSGYSSVTLKSKAKRIR
ncbi:hypothetical protein [Nocardioides sp. B-3]|uniref:hypothetical protein n=1 Tax=Nocardioides sp. B-3 TaxID=2895565 RepID=UPI00215372A7|nr:hypothetical protein [Nocardioides sp. B-3]UUZ59237.1 hypothetical protein LP418_25680 [Nocardioides sp. B-3]